jgi:hypothetical protein
MRTTQQFEERIHREINPKQRVVDSIESRILTVAFGFHRRPLSLTWDIVWCYPSFPYKRYAVDCFAADTGPRRLIRLVRLPRGAVAVRLMFPLLSAVGVDAFGNRVAVDAEGGGGV